MLHQRSLDHLVPVPDDEFRDHVARLLHEGDYVVGGEWEGGVREEVDRHVRAGNFEGVGEGAEG